MQLNELTFAILIGIICAWSLCAVAAAVIGSARNAGAAGFFYGFLFGPVGLAVACKLDRRPICQSCQNRIDFSDYICPYCGE